MATTATTQQRREVSGAELARACGVTPAQMSFILNGQRSPSLALAIRMADHYGCTLDTLVQRLRLREVVEGRPWQGQAA